MRSFLEQVADLACFSGHEFLAGPTSSIVAGRKELVEACLFHQYHGIGQAMKLGREGIIGAIAGLELWENLDHDRKQQVREQIVERLLDNLKGITGLLVHAEPDPTGNPIRRTTIKGDPKPVGLNAFEILLPLKESSPPIVVHDHEAIDLGYFQLDRCDIHREQVDFVTREIRRIANLSDEDKKRLRARLPQRPNDADLLIKSLTGWIPE
jgi:D-glucosaminate-6-phosphate ammonia-lyase